MTTATDEGEPLSGNPFHPDLRVFRWVPHVGIGPFARAVSRRLDRVTARRGTSGAEVVRVSPTASVRVHRPPAAVEGRGPALLWVHGGGYVLGTARQDDGLCREIASRLGVLVVAVDHRLAPEDPYPAALDDCYDALTWLAARDDVDSDRVAVGGASAGAGLAAALALRARDLGVVSPVLQLLVYPMLDDRTVTRDADASPHLRIWTTRSNAYGWTSYLGRAPGSPDVPYLAAPARCPDLTGVAPAWVGVGTLDLFHDEDLAYVEALRAAGVRCALDVVPGAFHGFDAIRPDAGVSQDFRAAQLTALADALGVRVGRPG